MALAGLIFLIGGGIAVFHVGVEQHWWQGTAECGGASIARTLEELRAQLIGRPVVRCDQAQFHFLGLSMAGWNALISAAYAAFSLAAAKARLTIGSAR
jgi:disulfide bond formation protein DsbB